MSKKADLAAQMRTLEKQIEALVKESFNNRKAGNDTAARELLQKAVAVQEEWKTAAREFDRVNPADMTEEEINEVYSNAKHIASLKARGLI